MDDEQSSIHPSPQAPEASIGHRLRSARAARDLSVVAAADALKIRPRFLEALEHDRWEELPGEVYAQGFLRSYAQYLGLNGEALVAERRHQVPSRHDIPPHRRYRPAPNPPNRASQPSLRHRTSLAAPKRQPAGGTVVGIMAGLVVLIVGGLWYLHAMSGKTVAPVAVPSSSHPRAHTPPPTPSRSVSTPPAVSSTPKRPLVTQVSATPQQMIYAVPFSPYQVVVNFTGRCWVGANGNQVGHIYTAGERATFSSSSQLTLVFGVADAAGITVNGQSLGIVGSSNSVRTIIFRAARATPSSP